MTSNYKALARKWRPNNFKHFVGQANTVKTLTNSLDNNRLHHAYLFSGTRGVGKTTIARIIAKCISCQNGVSSTPCNNCNSCQSIDSGSYIDLIEVDAASKTKVEDTRELLDNLQFAPSSGKFKIYIIDEVHMLSKHSFNALLKTLEEPPAHVKFIFATTEVAKLPITVISRCIHFKLSSISDNEIINHINKILTSEKIAFEDNALIEITKAAKGSLRDALSILEQCIAFSGNNLSMHGINDILGIIGQDHILDLFEYILAKDTVSALSKLDEISNMCVDLHLIMEDIIEILHSIALAQISPELVQNKPFNLVKILDYANKVDANNIQLLYQVALLGRKDLAITPNLKSGVEMLIIRLIHFQPEIGITKKESPPISKQAVSDTNLLNSVQKETISKSKNSEKKNIPSNEEGWHQLIKELKLSGLSKVIAEHCQLTINDDQYHLLLSSTKSNLLTDNIKQQITKAIQDKTSRNVKVFFTIADTKSNLITPASIISKENEEKRVKMEQEILTDDSARYIMDKFNATLTEVSSSNTEIEN